MRTLATGGRGGGNGGDGGRGDADMWESRKEGDWWLLVSPLQGSYSVLQRAATGTSLAQLQLPITASAARQAVVIDVHNVHQQSWEPHCEAGRDSGNTP